MHEPPIPNHISSSNALLPYFDGCIGALDGTHIPVHVLEASCAAFRNQKGKITQNVLAVCTMDMRFIYMLLEGSTLDARVFEDARRKGFTIPENHYYLADAGYANSDALLIPYRGVRYHLREWGIAAERCVYIISMSCAQSNQSYPGPRTPESYSITGTRNSGMSSSGSLEL